MSTWPGSRAARFTSCLASLFLGMQDLHSSKLAAVPEAEPTQAKSAIGSTPNLQRLSVYAFEAAVSMRELTWRQQYRRKRWWCPSE